MWFKWIFGFVGWANKNICWCCHANTTDIPYHDFTDSATWKQQRHTTMSFMPALKKTCGII